MKPAFNLHSHTKRCGHAYGEDEEYAEAAYSSGLSSMGFSDHAMIKGVSDPGMRGEYGELEGYISSVTGLKEKYRGKMDVFLGMECEYMPGLYGYYRDLLDRRGFDYLILGQHCFFDKDGNTTFYWQLGEIEAIRRYAEDLIKGMESGLFLYVAHPDLMAISLRTPGGLQAFMEASVRIAEAAVALDMPLEINMGRSRNPYRRTKYPEYPDRRFWEIAKRKGAKCLLGIDAHSPGDYFSSPFRYFDDFVGELGLTPIGTCPLKAGK